MPERWLVISHEAGNSGAPRMLLEVLRGVRAVRGAEWSCEILLGRGGALLDAFARLGPVHLLAHPWGEGRTLRAGLYRKFWDRPWIQPRRLAGWVRQWGGRGFDLVYNNTATNGYLVPAARRVGGVVLTHVHELGYALRRFNSPASLSQTLENTAHFLAVSPATADDLGECGIPTERITVVPNFLSSLPPVAEPSARAGLRARLGVEVETQVIVGCGHIDWLKGPDLFVEMAAACARLTSQKRLFLWLGGVSDARFARKLRRLVRRRGLENVVRFVGEVENSAPWFAASDVVAVTSRIESFSLVALEAGALGRPVVGFAKARGLSSVLGEGAGLLVPEFDPSAMAAVVNELLLDPTRGDREGRRLRARIEAGFMAGPRIEAILKVTDRLRKSRERVP